jgi:hypothetical protein
MLIIMDRFVPCLIDSKTGIYMQDTLKKCHEFRVQTYSWAFNFGLVFIFISFVCLGLYICFTRKKSPAEEKEKILNDQRIILEKIRSLKEQKQNYYQEDSMTHLPFTEH